MADILEVIKNIENLYSNNTALSVLKDYERVLEVLDIYVYENWLEGELLEGPRVDRHWVTCKFMWPKENMPNPRAAKRLLEHDCRVKFEESFILQPRKIESPDDFRPGTRTHGVVGNRIDRFADVPCGTIGHRELTTRTVQASEGIDSVVVADRIAVLDAISDSVVDRNSRAQKDVPLSAEPYPTPVANLGRAPTSLRTATVEDRVENSPFAHQDGVAQAVGDRIEFSCDVAAKDPIGSGLRCRGYRSGWTWVIGSRTERVPKTRTRIAETWISTSTCASKVIAARISAARISSRCGIRVDLVVRTSRIRRTSENRCYQLTDGRGSVQRWRGGVGRAPSKRGIRKGVGTKIQLVPIVPKRLRLDKRHQLMHQSKPTGLTRRAPFRMPPTGSVGTQHSEWKPPIGRFEIVIGHPPLPEVVRALHPSRSLSGRLNRREKQPNKHADDRNDDQQFHQSKASYKPPSHIHGLALRERKENREEIYL